jgi:arsenite-transporting ATPase
VEIDANAALGAFLEQHGGALKTIIARGTYLADEDLSRFLDLHFPGLDEVMALLQIREFLLGEAYDTVVVDTAPTGHTLRLLGLPALVDKWVRFLDTLLEKHRYLSRLYARRYRGDEADDLLHTLMHDIGKVQRLLQAREQSQFIPVTIPEGMVLAETRKLVAWLSAAKIPARHLVVNRLIPPSPGCPFCTAKRQAQQGHLQTLRALFPTLSCTSVPLFPEEVRGQGALERLAAGMRKGLDLDPRLALGGADGRGSASVGGASPTRRSTPVRISKPGPQVKLLLFGGKGGVGKTSVACAFAVQLSALYPEQRVLLFSTDPAHSLADCLEQVVGEQVAAVKGRGNLFALEIAPESRFQRFKEGYAEEMAEILEGVTRRSHLDVPFDRDVLTNLLDLTPPGLDEIMALLEIAALMQAGAYDLLILDNAPTGHLLRFLELPDLMQEWLRTFFALILKYRGVARLPRTSALLVQMSKDLKEIRTRLSDSEGCEFIPVAIPTLMAFKETGRLLSHLERLNIRCRRLIVNLALLESDGCGQCSALRAEQEGVIATFRQAFSTLELVTLPWLLREVKGIDALAAFFQFTEP